MKKGIEFRFRKVPFWRVKVAVCWRVAWRFGFEGLDPWNKKRWTAELPFVTVFYYDPSIPDMEDVKFYAELMLKGKNLST